ncbi:hypothetical protein C5167_045233 [Papaver somniferum]|uniref:glucan endo-1,3-beta-D-glucosidase n=1 Tax=Papaver somniferum TaxID=3469 RepID=A0A4Y7LA96_PAPSO|nr:glucan endo-1,3-beta-glucosidase 14-like [Papaver somniferum]RZC82444.1 hypothetical protein C5167_045233 [Papaver somniferum]
MDTWISFRALFFLLLMSGFVVEIQSLGVGINYGQIANNLPSPQRVAVLLQSLRINKVKLYDADPNVLRAFANTNVEFIVGLGNEHISDMTDPTKAEAWVKQYVQPFLPQTKITCITVGNEVFGSNLANAQPEIMTNLLPAMKTVYNALVSLGLSSQVNVTTAHSLTILSSSYPPSSGVFREDFASYIKPILDFHAQVKSPFLINAYPFFAYKDNPNEVSLDYVLFKPNQGMVDPVTNLHYDNMLYAQIDAVYAAMKAMGHSDVDIKISETGWPSKGDENEVGANPQNAGEYHRNLISRVQQDKGTPMKPSVPIDIFVFALFNENMKPGPASERNYGLFYPDGRPVYSLGAQGQGPQGYLPELVYSSASKVQVMSIFGFLFFIMGFLIHV